MLADADESWLTQITFISLHDTRKPMGWVHDAKMWLASSSRIAKCCLSWVSDPSFGGLSKAILSIS